MDMESSDTFISFEVAIVIWLVNSKTLASCPIIECFFRGRLFEKFVLFYQPCDSMIAIKGY